MEKEWGRKEWRSNKIEEMRLRMIEENGFRLGYREGTRSQTGQRKRGITRKESGRKEGYGESERGGKGMVDNQKERKEEKRKDK